MSVNLPASHTPLGQYGLLPRSILHKERGRANRWASPKLRPSVLPFRVVRRLRFGIRFAQFVQRSELSATGLSSSTHGPLPLCPLQESVPR